MQRAISTGATDFATVIRQMLSAESGIAPEARDALEKWLGQTVGEDTVEKGGEYESFIEKFKKEPKNVFIKGLANDSDIYNFWRTYMDTIDSLLNEIEYFKKAPEEIGVYQYVIDSTKEAIELVVKMLAE